MSDVTEAGTIQELPRRSTSNPSLMFNGDKILFHENNVSKL